MSRFFAGVTAYVVEELWDIVRENAVPLSANLVIVLVFLLWVYEVLMLLFWVTKKLWPLLSWSG